MSRLFLFYLLIYGGMNLYIGVRLSVLTRKWAPWGHVGLALFLLGMIAGPIVSRLLERTALVWLAQIIGLVTHTWMALALWFFFLGVAIDLWNLLVRGASAWAWKGASVLRVGAVQGLMFMGVMIGLATIWGAVEAQYLHVRTVTMKSSRLPAGSPPIRIVQVSDIHLGLIEREGRVRQILRIIERLEPDMVVSTGDVVDGTAHHMDRVVRLWAGCRPPLGKYAILGNHEFYAGLERSLGLLSEAGFQVLRGSAAAPDPRLLVAGVDDPAGLRRTPKLLADENALLPSTGAARPFTLFLKHRPWIEASSLGRFDLQLSGHTHSGQVFPFGLVVRTQYPYLHGFFDLGEGSALYVSRGTGTWGPRLRLAAPPEVTLITIAPAGS